MEPEHIAHLVQPGPRASGSALDFPFRTFIFSGMSMAFSQSLIQEFLTWISPNIILSGQVDLIINGYPISRSCL